MDCFIKKIFDGKIASDELVHSQFIKFSKGKFPEKAMIRAKKSKEGFTIATTYEYAKDLIMTLAEKLGDNKTRVTGALMSTLDLDFDYEERKMAMGVRKYMLDREMTGRQILELCRKMDKAFFGLSFNAGETELIISPKSPKSAKGVSSAKKEEGDSKIDFIKIKTKDVELVKNLIFDKEVENFNKIEIKHIFEIDSIVLPKGETDFAKIREMAKRKGKIIREISIDCIKLKKEVNFEA